MGANLSSRDVASWTLVGIIYPVTGKYEKSLEEARKAIELDPDLALEYAVLASSSMALDRLGEAEDALQRASKRKLEIPELWLVRYDIAFLKADSAGMERLAALSQENLERKT